MYPATLDRPDGCDKIHGQEKLSCHAHWENDEHLAWAGNKIPPKVAGGTGSMTCGTKAS